MCSAVSMVPVLSGRLLALLVHFQPVRSGPFAGAAGGRHRGSARGHSSEGLRKVLWVGESDTWRFMGSYKWGFKSPNMGYNHKYPLEP